MNITLAEALLRRKELNAKVARLDKINVERMFELRCERKPAAEGIDDIKAQVPKVALQQVTAGYDYYAKALRKIDLVIQQANHQTQVGIDAEVMDDFIDPYVVEESKQIK